MKRLGLVKDAASIARAASGEATEGPHRSPGRGSPYWKSRVLRRQVLGEEDEGGGAAWGHTRWRREGDSAWGRPKARDGRPRRYGLTAEPPLHYLRSVRPPDSGLLPHMMGSGSSRREKR